MHSLILKNKIHSYWIGYKIKMSRPKWLAVGKHSTNYQTISQQCPLRGQNNKEFHIQSSNHHNRLSSLNFDTGMQIDSPLYKTSEDRNLSSDRDSMQMIDKRDQNKYLLKQDSDNILMFSEGEINFAMKHLDSGDDYRQDDGVIMNQGMKDRQRHLPVYMKQQHVSCSIREYSPVIAYQGSNYTPSLRNQQQQPQNRIQQEHQQQSIIIEEQDMNNDNQSQSQNNYHQNSITRMQQLSVHQSEEGNYSHHYQQQDYSAEGSEIIEAVSLVQQQPSSNQQNNKNDLLHQQSKNANQQSRNQNQHSNYVNEKYPSVKSQDSSSYVQLQPILFQNIFSRLSHQKQHSGVLPKSRQSDRSWHSQKVKINLSKEHRFEDYTDRGLVVQNKMNSNILGGEQQSDFNRNRQMLVTRIRHKLQQVSQLNNELKVIKETIKQQIKFCESGGRMELFLWDRIKHDKLFLDISQRFLTGIQKIVVGERVSTRSENKLTKNNNTKLKLTLSKPTISLYISPSFQRQAYSNRSNRVNESEYLQKINRLQSELQLSQLQCASLGSEKESLQQELFTVQQQLIGVEMEIQERVRRQLRQLQLSLQTRIREELKPQLEQSLIASNKTACYIQTIDTLTKQIQDLTNKCIHYENYIMQHQQLNKQLQQQRIRQHQQLYNQLQQQNTKHPHQESISNQHYDQLFIQKMDQLQLRQQALTQVEKELLQMDAHLRQVQTQLNQEENQLINRETQLASKEEEVDKAIEEINLKQEQLYNWQNQLQSQQNNITLKLNQFQLLKTQSPSNQPKPNPTKNTYHHYHQYTPNPTSNQHLLTSNQQIVNSNQQTSSSPFFKYRDNRNQLPRGAFTQSAITQKVKPTVGYGNTSSANSSYNKLSKQLNKLYTNKYSLIPVTNNNTPTQSLSPKKSGPLTNNRNYTLNTQNINEKQSREQFISQIISKHHLQTEPINIREQIRKNKEERYLPKRQGVNEMFSRSQVYSSISNRPKFPIFQCNSGNQPHRQQRYTSTHNISMNSPTPTNYYKPDRSVVSNYKHDQYNPSHNTKKLSTSYQNLSYFSSNNNDAINSVNINNIDSGRINGYKSPFYSPKNSQYNHKSFNRPVSQINKQIPLSSYSNRSFAKQALPASAISQKLQKLKQQIKKQVKQLE